MKKTVSSLLKHILRYIYTTFHLDRVSLLGGLRIMLCTVIPILVGLLAKRPDLGMMGFLGALYVCLADVGGAYRSRALAMSLATIGIALAAFVATLVGGSVWLAVPCMFLCAFCCGMLNIYGSVGSKVGFVITGIFIIIMGQPGTLMLASERCLFFIVGGVWSMLLTLWVWPWQPEQPLRSALASYYRSVSLFAQHMSSEIGDERTNWQVAVQADRVRVREAHDAAHAIVMAFCAARGETAIRSERFSSVMLTADRTFNAIIAMAENIELAFSQTQERTIRATLTSSVQILTKMLARLAEQIEHDGAYTEAQLRQDTAHLIVLEQDLQRALPAYTTQDTLVASLHSMLRLQMQLAEELQTAFAHVASLHVAEESFPEGQYTDARPLAALSDTTDDVKNWVTMLRDNLTPRSLNFRHALRIALSTALAVALYIPLHVINGYWIPLTILFILKPDYSGTRQRAGQRIVGTVLGGIAAAFLVSGVHNEYLLIALLAAIGFLTFAHVSGDYGIFVTFLTLFVVVLLDLSIHGNWTFALIRIGNTVLGGVIAILFGYLFWPLWEQERLPAQLARTIRANHAYFRAVMSAYADTDGQRDTNAIQQASKQAHLENANAVAALQRLLSEPKRKQGNVESFSALVSYNQHFCDRVTALAAHLPSAHGQKPLAFPAIVTFTRRIEEALCELEAAASRSERTSGMPKDDESLQLLRRRALHTTIAEGLSEIEASLDQSGEQARPEVVHTISFLGRQLQRLGDDVSSMAQLQL